MAGFETQITLHRVTEVAKDASIIQRRPDVANALATNQVKQDAQHQQEQIVTIDQVELSAIQKDKQEDGGAGHAPRKRNKQGEKNETDPKVKVPPGEKRKIDILI